MEKPREIWVQDDGGPQFDSIISSIPTPRGTLFIEKSAYDKLEAALAKAKEALDFYSVNGLAKAQWGERFDERIAQEVYISGGHARKAISEIEEILK